MPQCGIELTSNEPALLSYLVNRPEKHSWAVTAVEGTYYLISHHFEELATAQEVWQAADDLLFVLNGIMKLKFKHAHLVRGNAVAYFDNGHLIRKTGFRNISCSVSLSVGAQYFQFTDVQNISSMNIWMKAQSDVSVREALQHYSNEHNWFNLYKVYEIIKKETGRLQAARVIAQNTFDQWTKGRKLDFEESANKGRHSSLGYQPRPGKTIIYMSLQEADEFVTDLFFLWLQSK